MKSQSRLLSLCAGIVFASTVFSAENANDSYLYREKCPIGDIPPGYTTKFPGGNIEGGYWVKYNPAKPKASAFWSDKWGFAQCNCTSYVTNKLVESWGGRGLRSLYVDAAWSNASSWKQVAIDAKIGVTNARADFVWNASDKWVNGVPPYNGAFVGDVAWWGAGSHGAGDAGHVARTESVQQGAYGKGVACVDVSEYNVVANNYGTRHLCRGDASFPDAFIHITQDYEYCLKNPSDCPRFIAQLNNTRQLALNDDSLYGFGGGSEVAGPMPVTGGTNTGTLPNLIANNSDVENASKTKVTTLHINNPVAIYQNLTYHENITKHKNSL